jgi:ABC-2 type transport system permease protein
MNALALVWHQLTFEWRAYWRNPAAAFFGFAFPLIFLVIFNVLFGNDTVRGVGGQTIRASTFYVPAIAAMSVVNSCFTGLAMGTAISRDAGVLKRVRGTPLPAWAYLSARVLLVTIIAVIVMAIVLAAGALVFGATLTARTLPAFFVTFVLGAATCSALGLAVTAIVPNADAAPPIVNGIVLPLLFISDIFIPPGRAPHWVSTVADVFPLRHLSHALQTAFSPFTTGAGFERNDLAMLLLWAVIGAVLARRFFSWEPRR